MKEFPEGNWWHVLHSVLSVEVIALKDDVTFFFL